MFLMTVAILSGLARVGRIVFPCTIAVLFLLMVTLIHLERCSFLEVLWCISDAAQLSIKLTESDPKILLTYQTRTYILF